MESGHFTAMAASLWLVACPVRDGDPNSTASHSPQPASPTSNDPLTPAPSPPAHGDFLGNWIGAPCGERSYPRVILLEDGGGVSGQDNISPCPPNVACVWSGIVRFGGTWRREGKRVVFALKPESNHPIAPLPSELYGSSSGPLVTEGGDRCPYRSLTEPSH
jgi:hypothetical protein